MINFEDELAKLSPERRVQIEVKTEELHREYLVLRKLREQLNLSQREVANRLGVTQSKVSRLENGERQLTLGTFNEIVHALGGKWEITIEIPELGEIKWIGEDLVKEFLASDNELGEQPTV